MKRPEKIDVVFLTFILLISTVTISIAMVNEHEYGHDFCEKTVEHKINIIPNWTLSQITFHDLYIVPHDPIYINGDDDFTESNGVIAGEGTIQNPYLIKGWNISCDKDDGIVIRNTRNYFIISDCYIHDGGDTRDGIVFMNVQNGLIQNNTIAENRNGIMFATQQQGKENSENNIITNNEIIFNNYDGIYFEHTCRGWHQENEISHNNISYNNAGIYMIMSDSNTICYNNFVLNDVIGIFIDQCMGGGENNRVHHNNFVKNGLNEQGSNLQAIDIGVTNFWNNSYPSGGNYWSDYEGIDYYSGPNQLIPGSDGIGDIPYVIRNHSNIQWLPLRNDSYPLMEPVGTVDFPLPPIKPIINGSQFSKENTLEQFNISSIDPNDELVYFSIDWGDGIVDEWMGPHESGAVISFNHSWDNQGFYKIIVKVKDESAQGQQKMISYSNLTIIIFPESAMVNPSSGLYILNTQIFDFDKSILPSIIFGNIDVKVEVLTDELDIEKVEYYVNDDLQHLVYSEPYIWTWDKLGLSRYHLETIVYSAFGYNMSYQKTVWKFL